METDWGRAMMAEYLGNFTKMRGLVIQTILALWNRPMRTADFRKMAYRDIMNDNQRLYKLLDHCVESGFVYWTRRIERGRVMIADEQARWIMAEAAGIARRQAQSVVDGHDHLIYRLGGDRDMNKTTKF